MIDGNQLREEFGRYLAEHKATRWGMDAALMHVCKIAYDAGRADGPAEPERRIGPASDADMAVYQSIADGYARDTAPAPAEALGETCIDGGKCHHACTDKCFRRECCVPLSGYAGPWAYAPAEVPMPEPDAIDGTSQVSIAGCMGLGVVRVTPSYSEPKMRTYGAACRAAGEAAGYARGRAEAGQDAERRGQFLVECDDVALRVGPEHLGLCDAIDNDGQPYQSQALADEITALRGEVKP